MFTIERLLKVHIVYTQGAKQSGVVPKSLQIRRCRNQNEAHTSRIGGGKSMGRVRVDSVSWSVKDERGGKVYTTYGMEYAMCDAGIRARKYVIDSHSLKTEMQ